MTDPASGPPPSEETAAPYGRPSQGYSPLPQMSGPPVPPVAQVTEYPVSFTGSAGEYFRLWIVNIALTLVTLGIYLPWMRVRNRQYMYGHTYLDGHNFEYRANPLAMLRSYLLVAALFAAYAVAGQFEQYQWVALVLGALFFLLYPWLVRQAMRFQAANTLHRGLRFRFHGQTGESYVAYMLGNFLSGITFSLALPWAWFMQRRYQVSNLAYGSAKATFRGDVGPFYLIGLTALGLSIGGGVLLLIPLMALLAATLGLNGDRLLGNSGGSVNSVNTVLAGVLLAYGVVVLLYLVVWQYVRGAIMAYVLNNVELGGVVRARATFSPWQLMWISVTNALAQVFTLGLATPWAAVRRTRYVLGGTFIRAIASLDDFATGVGQDESALGDAASDLLDIQVGF